jgi:NAD(P)H-hydrate epimerase
MNTEISPSEMRRVDANCGSIGLLPLQLMENAGASVARAIRARFPDSTETKIIVLAGTGNNGGDGFVAATGH